MTKWASHLGGPFLWVKDKIIMVDTHIAGQWWDLGPTFEPLRRGDAIRLSALNLISLRRNK